MPDTPPTPQDAPSVTPSPSAPQQPAQAENAGQKTILIVEDEKPLSHALEMKLKNQGFNAKTVMDGEEALAALKEGDVSMVLLDLIMPKLDGFSVMQEMQQRGIHLPVIVLSNLGQDEDRAKAKDLGALNYFVKSNTPIAEIVAAVIATLY